MLVLLLLLMDVAGAAVMQIDDGVVWCRAHQQRLCCGRQRRRCDERRRQ